MKHKIGHILQFVLMLFCIFFLSHQTVSAMYDGENILSLPRFAPNEVIVKYKAHSDPKTLQAQQMGVNATSTDRASAITQLEQINQFNHAQGLIASDTTTPYSKNTYLYKTDGTKKIDDIVASYGANQAVEYAQPNYYYYTMATPNDTNYAQMWGLAKINMPGAWDVIKGLKSVIVADIDTGIIRNHED